MLSHHYMRALRYLPQGETVSPQLLAAARSALCDAGDRSMSLNAFAEAAHFFAEALQLWPEDVPGRADVAFRRAAHGCMPRAGATSRWGRPAMRSSPRASPERRPRRWC